MDPIQANLTAMQSPAGMDIVIISTACPRQAEYWQQRLDHTRGPICRSDATIITVFEDWSGGAGNALGTLYALQKAQEQSGIDMLQALSDGKAIAIYHTAGKGTRLAPLSGSEKNNKSSVKLPSVIITPKQHYILTILEAVIKQSSIYASSRQGRLSVFWGDQIFIPSEPHLYTPKHAVDILARRVPELSSQLWEQENLSSYGLLTRGADACAQQIEKVDHATFSNLVQDGRLDASDGLYISLGSFSLSRDFCAQLLQLFSGELHRREGYLDSDPHWWMPLSLDLYTYLDVMSRKGTDRDWARDHYSRMQGLTASIGVVDIGSASYWWDYGQVRHYQDNILKMIGEGAEAKAMRQFFNARRMPASLNTPIGVHVDSHSCLIDCDIRSGDVHNSVLVGVTAKHVDIKDSVVINVTAPQIHCNDSLLYNVLDASGVCLKEHTVRADAFMPLEDQHLRFYTHRDRDGRSDWSRVLPSNLLSYESLHHLNLQMDLKQADDVAAALRKDVARLIK